MKIISILMITIFCSLFYISGVYAGSSESADPGKASEGQQEDFKEMIRPYLEKYLGSELAVTILGPAPVIVIVSKIKLPPIPTIVHNAKSMDVYRNQEAGKGRTTKLTLTKDQQDAENYRFVTEIYQATLLRSPTEQEFEKWINTLEQGASREGIYRALALSTTYDELEKYRDGPSAKLLQFTQDYLKKYINLKIEEKILQEQNLFSIKRYCVEKSLELIDILSKDENALSDWYAVLSEELAVKFPANFKQWKTRKNTSPEYHKKWAKTVPQDYLKSEVMIKLHMAFNSLK